MTSDILEGKWKHVKGQMKEWWGQLTDDDLDKIAGKRDKLVGRLQERYGWAKQKAEEEVAQRLRELEDVDRSKSKAEHEDPVKHAKR